MRLLHVALMAISVAVVACGSSESTEPDVAAPECTTDTGKPGAIVEDDCGEICNLAADCTPAPAGQTASCLPLPHVHGKVCTYWESDGGP